MPDSFRNMLNKADAAVLEVKEKQFRTLVLLLAVLVLLTEIYHFYRVFLTGIGETLEVIAPTVSYLMILACLFPSRVLSFAIRKSILALGGFFAGISAMLAVGTQGAGYILIVLDAFVIHYFFEKKSATILIFILLFITAAVSILRILGLLPPIPSISAEALNAYTISKIFVVIATVTSFHFMYNRSTDILKSSINESIVSQEKLRMERLAVNEYLESIPGIFFLLNDNWLLERWNQNLSAITGYSIDELKNKPVLDFFEPDLHPLIRQSISDIFLKGSVYAEGDLRSKDGSKHPFAFTGRAVSVDNRTLACGIGLDLTEKRRLEKEVQEAQKMEALGTLAGGVAHDLNNVLGGIIGFTEIIQASIEDGELPDIKHTEVVLNSCKRAAGIVQQILLFSRRTEEKKIPIQLSSVVRDALKLIRHTVPKSIEIVEQISKSKDVVFADINQLHQVIMNVCTNAWHAMRDNGGTLTVAVETVNVATNEIPEKYRALPGRFQKVTVQDTGIGVPKDVADSIFDPFFTTKPVGEGTGLGLAVVDKIVKKHDGFLTFSSEVGKGTRFYIFFPVQNQEAEPEEHPRDAKLPRGTEHILIVDDEPTIRSATKIILEGLGYTVSTAENGEEGLVLFNQHKNDIKLVITDFSMPKKNGGFMAQAILDINEKLPIVLCTGYSETLELQRIATSHFAAVLHKPLQRAELANLVRNLVDGIPIHRPSDLRKLD